MIQEEFAINIHRNTVASKRPSVEKPTSSPVKLFLPVYTFRQTDRHSDSQWKYTWKMTSLLIVPTEP